MSKIIAQGAIRGAHATVERAEQALKEALDKYGADHKIEFPNTGYYLPVIHAMTGMQVNNLGDMTSVLERAKGLLGKVPTDNLWLPYLGEVLDSGMATLFADEIIEGTKYANGDVPYHIAENCPDVGDNFWLGAADDIILRKRGIEFVDGTAPGFAAIVGAAPTDEEAVAIARELQSKNLYVFMSSETNGVSFAEQLRRQGVQMGWETRLVPFGKDITSTVFALGFAVRAAMSFGGIQPGDFRSNLLYNKNRIFAFVLALGEVTDDKYAQAAGAINFGFPVIADTDIPQILPTGVCTYEHVVSSIPIPEIVQKAIDVRGLKIQIADIPIPVAYGPAFEGERIRKGEFQVDADGTKMPTAELLETKELNEVEDGKIEVVGKEIDEFEEGAVIPLGIHVMAAGRKWQPDFEPVLERQIHHFLTQAEGIMHMGQRNLLRIRFSKTGVDKGLRLHHIGEILNAKFKNEYAAIIDKLQIRIITDEAEAIKLRDQALDVYEQRDEKMATLTDEAVEEYYTCTLCQSFAPTHVCIVSPERLGLCGAVNWLDAKTGHQIDPSGGQHQPVIRGTAIDAVKGRFTGVDETMAKGSQGKVTELNLYSIMEHPMTSCGCFECIMAILPMCNGFMIVNREFSEMTPSGMKFSTLAGSVGGGQQTPGFMGVGKNYMLSKKFLGAEGGLARIVWMPKMLKEMMRDKLQARADEIGIPDLLDKIADENVGTDEETVMNWLAEVGHPALTMESLF